jgi:hypothetical protein
VVGDALANHGVVTWTAARCRRIQPAREGKHDCTAASGVSLARALPLAWSVEPIRTRSGASFCFRCELHLVPSHVVKVVAVIKGDRVLHITRASHHPVCATFGHARDGAGVVDAVVKRDEHARSDRIPRRQGLA